MATRVYKKKRKFVSWSGDAFYDWQAGVLTIPDKGILVGSLVESDVSLWPDYDGDIPGTDDEPIGGSLQVIVLAGPRWDSSKDHEVPDLSVL